MNIKIIDLDKIKALPFLQDKSLIFLEEKLKKSLASNGFIYPIRCHIRNKNYYVIDGNKRYYLAKELNIKKVPVIIDNYKSEKSSFILHLHFNKFRNFNEIEISLLISSAINYFNDELLAKYILVETEKKYSKKIIENYLKLSNLILEGKKLLLENRLNLNVAINISKFSQETQNFFLKLIKNLKLNSNKQKKVFEYIYDLSKRNSKDFHEILKSFNKFIDKEFSRNLEEQFFEKLISMHSPDFYKFHKKFLELKAKITKDMKGINILSPTNFEDETYKTELFFKNFNELKEKLKNLEKNIEKFNLQ